MSELLKKWQSGGIQVTVLRQIVLIADFFQLGDLLLAGQPFQVIHFFRVDASNVLAHRFRQGSFGEELRPRRRVHSGDQAIFAEGLLIEKRRGAQVGVQFLIVRFEKLASFDAEVLQQRFGNVAVLPGTLNGLGPPIAENGAAADLKLIAFGVAAEIVVIVEQQNFCGLARLPLIEARRGQSTDACSNNHQVVGFARIDRRSKCGRRLTIAAFVRDRKTSVMVAAHTHF